MAASRPAVRVLLSVHQGADYIGEQLDSLRRQEDVVVRLGYHVDSGDDGSERQIAMAFPDADRLEHDPGLGLPRAYLALLGGFADDSDVFAFCDQDDVWDPRKLSTAAAVLSTAGDTPALWVCRAQVLADEEAGTNGTLVPRVLARPSLGNALVETLAPGCTMVWNRALHRILVAHLPQQGVLMHDAWVYLVAAAVSEVIVERRPYVRYRLHGGNAVGVARGPSARMRRFMRIPGGEIPTISSQAAEFLRLFGPDLARADRDLVRALARWDRRALATAWWHGRIRRSTRIDNLLLLPRLLAPPRFQGRVDEMSAG